jgi:hypothetical protein
MHFAGLDDKVDALEDFASIGDPGVEIGDLQHLF